MQRVSGQSPLWDWADVAQWLNDCGRLDSKDSEAKEVLVANARTLSKWNLALRIRAFGDVQALQTLTHSLLELQHQHTLR